MVRKELNIEEVKAFINAQSPETKVYLGGDSERFQIDGVWYADYTVVVLVHKNGNRGCKVFGEIQRERDSQSLYMEHLRTQREMISYNGWEKRVITEAAKQIEF